MRHVIWALALGMAFGCGGPPAKPFGAEPEIDAGAADAGISPISPCDEPGTASLCSDAVANVATCCNGVDNYVARSGADFCRFVGLNTGSPESACKNISAMTCPTVIAQGLCY